MNHYSRIKAVISLDAIASNFREMRKNINEKTKIIAVLKADGYGHGASAIASLIHDYDYIWGFATATAEEALSLRSDGVTKPILVLGHVFAEHYEALADREIRISVSSWKAAREYALAGDKVGKRVFVHVALDTGMSRIGFADQAESVADICRIYETPNVVLEGLFTHFARADEYDRSPAVKQLERYLHFLNLLKEAGIHIPVCHCSNSAGIIRMPESNLHAVRAGISIYGLYPSQEVEQDIVRLTPAMEIKSHISFVKTCPAGTAVSYGGTFVTERPTRIATIPVGYADGYPRLLSNKGWVLIRGQRAPILGRVCMDQFMVDITDIRQAEEGDEVTLLGKDGMEEITAEILGELSGRFPYEFVCDISKRVPRVYIRDGKECGDLTYFD